MQKLDDKQILRRAIELERGMMQDEAALGWEWFAIPSSPATLNRMVIDGLLKVTSKTNSSTNYRLNIPLDEAERMLEEKPAEVVEEERIEIPADIFAPLVGFDDIKETILRSLRAERPVHILLISPPATAAKSTFLMELERIRGATFLSLGSAATRVGLRDVIAEAPKLLLLDEIEKCANPLDLSSLMTWMESGRVTITKHGEHRDIRGKGWVFAAANTKRGLSPELLSRFMIFNIPPYDRNQYVEVVRRVLTMREGASPELADYIAKRLAEESRDVRDGIRIIRLCRSKDEVDETMKIIRRYKGDGSPPPSRKVYSLTLKHPLKG